MRDVSTRLESDFSMESMDDVPPDISEQGMEGRVTVTGVAAAVT